MGIKITDLKVWIISLPTDKKLFNILSQLVISHFQKYWRTIVVLKKIENEWEFIWILCLELGLTNINEDTLS
jgi:hypothetical protein